MQRMIDRVVVLLILTTAGITAAAQTASSSAASPRPPDMVCFGYGPKWSIQFINGEARYLGINQPDQYFLGDFFWVPEDKAWEWHRANDLAPMNGNYGLSATIQKAACNDPVRKQTYPFSSQVNLPSGDMVSGCCRKLRPGEAPVGKHGLPPTPPASGSSQSAAPGNTSTPQGPKPQPQ